MRSTNVTVGFISVLALAWFALLDVRAAEDPYILDAAAAAGKKDVVLMIPTNGSVQLGIIRTATTDIVTHVSLNLGRFRAEPDGQELPVVLSETNLDFASIQVLQDVVLHVSPLASANKYSGTLVLSASGLVPIVWRITLVRGDLNRYGTLAVDQPTLNCSLKRDWFECFRSGTSREPDLVFTLHGKTNSLAIQGIRVGYGAVTHPDGSDFDIEKNVTFFWNGKTIAALSQWPPSNPADIERRSITNGGQATLGLGFQTLSPGQYSMELKLGTLDSQEEDRQQKVTVTLKVADPVWPAILFLLVAILLSFFSYKWLTLYRQRLDLQARIAELRPEWLAQQPPSYTVAWVRTVLRQAEELTGKMVLVSPTFITERIDKVTPVLTALNEARRARLATQGLPPMVQKRFEAVINAQVRGIRDEAMNKAAADKAATELANLTTELANRTYVKRYWTEVDAAVRTLLAGFKTEDFEANCPPEGIAAKNELLSRLRPDGQPLAQPLEDELDIINYETVYAKLKLLIERRHYPLFDQLVAKIKGPLEDLFAVADDSAWSSISNAQLKIKPLVNNGGDGIEAYQPVTFAVTTGEELLDSTYLFTRGLRFEWTFQLGNAREYHTVTLSPRIAEFAPTNGLFKVSVKTLRETSSGTKIVPVQGTSLNIRKSSDLSWLQNVERTEVWSLSLAGLFAIISGLLTFYYKNPVFGSAQDYLALFLWGVGVEQGKNFIQTLQSTSQNK